MHTEHLILLEKSIDLMILRGFLDDLNPQHHKTGKLIFRVYNEIFTQINTPQDIWKIKYN